jgi:methylmalonyl-CoA mutase N-terminal domain/subunit
VRADRNPKQTDAALADVRTAAQGTANLLHPMRTALQAHCTIGEICGVLREEWGEHDRTAR